MAPNPTPTSTTSLNITVNDGGYNPGEPVVFNMGVTWILIIIISAVVEAFFVLIAYYRLQSITQRNKALDAAAVAQQHQEGGAAAAQKVENLVRHVQNQMTSTIQDLVTSNIQMQTLVPQETGT